MSKSKDKKDRAKELLADGVAEMVGSPAAMRDWIEFRSRFHQYSFRNCILIKQQIPDAEYVKGYAGWQDEGRQVQKGESGALIMYPMIKTVEDPEEWAEDVEEGDKVLIGFGTAYVFDFKQTRPTEGEESLTRDDIERDNAVKGESHFEILQTLQRVARDWGYEVAEETTLRGTIPNQPGGGPKGSVSFEEETIRLKKTLDANHKVKTVAHELAHTDLHAGWKTEEKAKNAERMEMQAEAVAFLVCNVLGLDTSEYSFEYVAAYTEEITDEAGEDEIRQIVKAEIEAIDSTADRILEALNGAHEKRMEEKEQEMNKAVTETLGTPSLKTASE